MAVKPKKSQQNREVTIDLVAAAAGVSRATVSRVMNGSAKVSPEREKAVKKAIAAYNFTPNATARRLAGGRSGLVAHSQMATSVQRLRKRQMQWEKLPSYSRTLIPAVLRTRLLHSTKIAEQ